MERRAVSIGWICLAPILLASGLAAGQPAQEAEAGFKSLPWRIEARSAWIGRGTLRVVHHGDRAYVDVRVRETLRGEPTERLRFSAYVGAPVSYRHLELKRLEGQERLLFLMKSEGSYFLARDSRRGGGEDSIYEPSDAVISAARRLIAKHEAWLRSPLPVPTAREQQIVDLAEDLTRSEAEQNRAFDRLCLLASTGLGPGATVEERNQTLTALGRLLGDRRPLARSWIRLENDFEGAFEAYRQYSPEVIGEAIAAILNDATYESFGFVYNGASDEERELCRRGWTLYLHHVLRGGRLRGRVVDSQGQAAPDVWVELRASSAVPREDLPSMTQTDGDGRFSFDGLPPGGYRARIRLGQAVIAESPELFVAAKEQQEVEVSLPPTGSLQGRIRWPYQSLNGRMVLRVVPESRSPDDSAHFDTRIDESGAFRAEPLPAGSARLLLIGPKDGETSAYLSIEGLKVNASREVVADLRGLGARTDVGRVDVMAGETARPDLDLTRFEWTELTIEAPLEPGSGGWTVEVTGPSDALVRGHFNEDGRVVLSPLPAGVWRIAVLGETWTYAHPEPVELRGGAARVELRWEMIEGRIRVLDPAEGQPLLNRSILIGDRSVVRTDELGELSLRGPIGAKTTLGLANTELSWTRDGLKPREIHVRPFDRPRQQ